MMVEAPHQERLLQVLRTTWGFDSLRPVQQEVIESSLANRDAVVVMPTGGGKSLCFQLPAVYSQRLTVVISPLIALMKDQVDALLTVGVSAAALNSSLNSEEEAEIRSRVRAGQISILYMSPERVLLPETMLLLREADGGLGVARIAIDEAHCISAWGHDFRPEFRQLSRLRQSFPDVPIQAFTATATPRVQRDIAIQLQMNRPRKFVGTFDRPNLSYRIIAKDDAIKLTLESVRRYPNEGVIVYCLSRKDTERIANALIANGVPARAYHAGLPNEVRKKISEDFAAERANIIVATIAFGMGIDRSNVRCVIHECLPKSMEGYQQETGRAGRDGMPSECILLYNHGDIIRLKRLMSGSSADLTEHHFALLEEVRRFITSHQCRHKTLSEYFGQHYVIPEGGCGACDVCLGGMKPLANSTEIAHKILCAIRTLGGGKPFGAGFLADFLTGANKKAIRERGATSFSEYGSLSDIAIERVTAWIYQLIDLDLITVSDGQYSTLSLSKVGSEALTNKAEISIVENVALTHQKSRRAKSGEIEASDPVLFELLRAWRREVATERGLPAYIILHDATLHRLCAIKPSTLTNLKQISGIGEKQSNDFGPALIKIIDEYCSSHSLEKDQSPDPAPHLGRGDKRPHTILFTSEFQTGMPIEEIAIKHQRTASTVLRHLESWIEESNPNSIANWVDNHQIERIKSAIRAENSPFLKPIFVALNEEISYEQIRIVRAWMRAREDNVSPKAL